MLTYFYDNINRNAIVVIPKQPLYDWINGIYPEDSPATINDDDQGTIYLVKERVSNDATEKWLSRNFDDIFVNELNNWHQDENDWPEKRTFKMFKEWFTYDIHSMVLDMEETEIDKD